MVADTPKIRKYHSIRRKITVLLLSAVLAALVVNSLLAVWNLHTIKTFFKEQSMQLGQGAAEDTETAMERMAGDQLLGTAVEKAAFIDEKFHTVIAGLHGIAQTAENIYENPQDYPEREVPLPVPESHELAAQLLWSRRLGNTEAENETLRREILKLGNLQDMLVQTNQNNDMISSAYVATCSGWMIQADYIAYRKYSDEHETPDFYEASERQWFQRAGSAAQGQVVYSDVIADIHEGTDCIVCAQPIYANGEIVAVAGIGSYLDTIHKAVLDTRIGQSGYAFLVDEKGQIMASGALSGETVATSDRTVDLRQSDNAELADAAVHMVSGESSLTRLVLDDREVYLAYAPLETLGWSFVTVMDVEEVVAPAMASQNTILTLTREVLGQVDVSIARSLLAFLVTAGLTFVIAGLSAVMFAGKLTEPILRLKKEVTETNGGNLDGYIRISTGDEIEDLGNAFNRMRMQLKSYITNLAQITAEKERIHAELSVATDIQADMLPDCKAIATEQRCFDLHAATWPAKEVGGDFYDFFLTDEEHLVFLVADVSGKGVPAALFMVIAKTLIENHMMRGEAPAEAFGNVNRELCRSNTSGMFLTAWLGMLNLADGHLVYVNAGHNSPLRFSGRAGRYEWHTERSGFVLAGMEDTEYVQKEMYLEKGDWLFLYSDGVTEANDAQQSMFGEDRLEAFLNAAKVISCRELCDRLRKELAEFQGEAEQFDDITMLSVCYYGAAESDTEQMSGDCPKQSQAGWEYAKEKEWQFDCPAEGSAQTDAMKSVEVFLEEQQVTNAERNRMLVALDEIFSNICRESKAVQAVVGCRVSEKEIRLWFVDDGVAFNPLERPKPELDKPLQERKEGGLGIYMVRKMMDDVNYERRNGKNYLILEYTRAKG
ncbi:MAG: SpoIIE family protein phosphatase [Lachnospiraceae bacterium]|nr:SpoIIE family protein phosphatase [Lachnospiraceae bacterium]